MAITNVVRLGWSLAGVILSCAWIACVSTAGSRSDLALGLGEDSGAATGNDSGGSSSGSSSGGSSSSSSSSSGGKVDAAPPTPDLCGFPMTDAASPVIYGGYTTGAAQLCGSAIPAPRAGNWFSYHDTTGDGGLTVTAGAGMGGCGGTSPCAYHAFGPVQDAGTGFAIYGAGVGFDLNDDMTGTPQNYDAMAAGYSGIQFWAKGTVTGTRTAGYILSPQTIHLKLVTATNRHGDDYGTYCTMIDPSVWTLCKLDFSAAKRDGFSTMPPTMGDVFDYNQLQKVQFELSLYTGTAAVTSVVFDIWVDEVSFY